MIGIALAALLGTRPFRFARQAAIFAPLTPILDHVVVNVLDRLDAAANQYRRPGFHLTERGHHTLGSPRARRPVRAKVQMIFQDPYGSLNPRHNVGKIVGQPLAVAGLPKREIRARVPRLMAPLGLAPDAGRRFPHEFSRGQGQRIGIARPTASPP